MKIKRCKSEMEKEMKMLDVKSRGDLKQIKNGSVVSRDLTATMNRGSVGRQRINISW